MSIHRFAVGSLIRNENGRVFFGADNALTYALENANFPRYELSCEHNISTWENVKR